VVAPAPPPDILLVKVITALLAQMVKFGLIVKVGLGCILMVMLSLTFEHKPELSIANKVKVMDDESRSLALKLYATFRELLDGVKMPVPPVIQR